MNRYKLKIKEIRKLKYMTQKQLADKIGVCQSFLSDIENEKWRINLEQLLEIAEVLDVEIKELYILKKEDKR